MKDEEVMRACQRGVGNYKGAIDDANSLLADCYGTIGRLLEDNRRLVAVMDDQIGEYNYDFCNRDYSE